MRIKKLLALLLAAAMALTLFAGCCSPSLLRLLLDLLQDQYQNVTVTAEADLEATLRQAVSENDTFEDITAALAQALDKTVEFDSLRSARAGDKTFGLVFKTGTDTEAIARQTYTEWNKILGALPSGGRYLADLAVYKSGGGYYILVNVTVQKGGSSGGSGSHSSGNDGGEDEEENGGGTQPPQTQLDYEWKGEDLILVHTNEGLQKVFFEDMSETDPKLMAAREDNSGALFPDGGFEDITIQLDSGKVYEVKETFGISSLGTLKTPFQGTLTSENPNNPAIINISGSPMFYSVGKMRIPSSSGKTGQVLNVDFHVTENISGIVVGQSILMAATVAYYNYGTISGCDVTFESERGINADASVVGAFVGGIAALQDGGKITGCSVTGGSIKVNIQTQTECYIGGIVGDISGGDSAVSNCHFTDNTIDVDVDKGDKVKCYVGGIAGCSRSITENNVYEPNDITLNGAAPTTTPGITTTGGGDIPNGRYVGKEIGYQRN